MLDEKFVKLPEWSVEVQPERSVDKNFAEIARWPVEGKPGWSFVLERPIAEIGIQHTSLHEGVTASDMWDLEQKGGVANFRISFREEIVWHIAISRITKVFQVMGGHVLVPDVFHMDDRSSRDPRAALDALDAAWGLLGRGELGVNDPGLEKIRYWQERGLRGQEQKYKLGPIEMAVNLETYFMLGVNPLTWSLADFISWYKEFRSEAM